MRVSICIPTFRRPEGLKRAVRSVFAQVGLSEFDAELVIVDNSPEGAALPLLQRMQATAPIPMRFAHERRAGVSHARNAAVKLATGDWLAWLDDDQEASALWLDRMIAATRNLRAEILFGPIAASAPAGPHRAYFESLYARAGPKENALLAAPLGIGNAMIARTLLLHTPAPFDVRANETGGEDDLFFAAAAARGAVFGWASGARVTEHVPAQRATMRYAMRRAFAYGQAPCETAAARGETLALARHMMIGAAQALWYGVCAAIAYTLRTESRAGLLDRAARGLGKVIWFRPQKFYGAAA